MRGKGPSLAWVILAVVLILSMATPALAYVAQAVNYYASQGRVGMAIAFASYTVANIGLLLDFYGI